MTFGNQPRECGDLRPKVGDPYFLPELIPFLIIVDLDVISFLDTKGSLPGIAPTKNIWLSPDPYKALL